MRRKTPAYWLFLRIGQYHSEEPLTIFERITDENDKLIRLFLFMYAQKLLQMDGVIDYPIKARLLDTKTGEVHEINYGLKDIKNVENEIVNT